MVDSEMLYSLKLTMEAKTSSPRRSLQLAVSTTRSRSGLQRSPRSARPTSRRTPTCAHSLRIGGATAALAASMSPATIRAAGRWSSDIYEIYCRISRQSAASVTSLISSTPFEDLERGATFIGEELILTDVEMHASSIETFCERDMIDDLCGKDDPF